MFVAALQGLAHQLNIPDAFDCVVVPSICQADQTGHEHFPHFLGIDSQPCINGTTLNAFAREAGRQKAVVKTFTTTGYDTSRRCCVHPTACKDRYGKRQSS